MEIVLAFQGLSTGPTTLDHRSLGGSETAGLMMAKELRKLGHMVTVFCNLPPANQPDHWTSGAQCEDGVRWVNFDQYASFVENTDLDLLIVSRNPDMLQIAHQAKKAVLWCHDLATYRQFVPKLMNISWNFSEIWAVSEWHRQQLHKISGYPLERIRATRNGIVKFDDLIDIPIIEKQLLYSARPERGLEYLVKEGGIMEKLPDYKLLVTMYENYPEQMMDYYRMLWARCEELPNVELLGPKLQKELRQLMKSCSAYIYPTAFEEVSCILARECIEQRLPFITTKVAALPETLGNCGIYYEGNKDIGSDEFIGEFVDLVKGFHEEENILAVHIAMQKEMKKRDDLYWNQVAEQWIGWSEPKQTNQYSRLWSLIQDSDIVAAIAYFESLSKDEITLGIKHLRNQLWNYYPFLFGKISFEDHYKKVYEFEDEKQVPERKKMVKLDNNSRYLAIKQEIAKLPEGSEILDYGCAEGPILLQLAQDFPHHKFVGIDFVEDNISLVQKFAFKNEIKNVSVYTGSIKQWPPTVNLEEFDAIIASEILEHVEKPWEILNFLEKGLIEGRIIITVPTGAWEINGLYHQKQWPWRAHIWHIDKWMLRKMIAKKSNVSIHSLTHGLSLDTRSTGHLCAAYDSDNDPIDPIDPLEKALQHNTRQTISAAIIAMTDEESVIKMLNSLDRQVQQIQVALGPSEDHTKEYMEQWAGQHPWIEFIIKDVQKIKPYKFGFDDARNASKEGLDGDWILWIDTDEYLSNNLLKYAQDNAFDSYAIHQHHFTCDPRGAPAQLDKPARMFRNTDKFRFYGKVHEHAENGFNGGPGFVYILSDVDIGHTGYVNENVRRARFNRNFPLLVWDQEIYPDRKLGKYLWLRDILHRLRYMCEINNFIEARRLAQEAIEFYERNNHLFASIGGGTMAGNQALAYYSEAMKILGKGQQIQISMSIDGTTSAYEGVFENADDALDLANKALTEQFDKRNSGYW